MFRVLFLTFCFFIPGLVLAKFPAPMCPYGLGVANADLALVGDSRAFLLGMADSDNGRVLRKSQLDGQDIFKSGIGSVQNIGWAGASATDPVSPLSVFLSGYFFFTVGALFPANVEVSDGQASNWNRQWTECATPYLPADKVVLNLGGNDMLDFYRVMEAQEQNYLILSALSNPVEYLTTLIFSPSKLEKKKEFFWYWQFEVKEDSTIRGQKAFAEKLLNGGSEVILVDVAPAYASKGGDFLDFHGLIRLTTYLSRLNVKMYGQLYPQLVSKYGNRVGFVDLFMPFLKNMLYDYGSYYTGQTGLGLSDGIHFGPEGNKRSGQILAAKMALAKEAGGMGWFPKYVNPSTGVPIADSDLQKITDSVPVDLSYLVGLPPTGGNCDALCWYFLCFLAGICN